MDGTRMALVWVALNDDLRPPLGAGEQGVSSLWREEAPESSDDSYNRPARERRHRNLRQTVGLCRES
jgi:hypothetical protein